MISYRPEYLVFVPYIRNKKDLLTDYMIPYRPEYLGMVLRLGIPTYRDHVFVNKIFFILRTKGTKAS